VPWILNRIEGDQVIVPATHGIVAVDREQRVNLGRLRRDRRAKAKELQANSEMASLLCVDMTDVRCLTSPHACRRHGIEADSGTDKYAN